MIPAPGFAGGRNYYGCARRDAALLLDGCGGKMCASVPRRPLALLLVLILVGGNAAVVQVIGWGSMLFERVQRMDLEAAVSSTFDGSAPCVMCRAAERLDGVGSPTAPSDPGKLIKKIDAVPVLIRAPIIDDIPVRLSAWPEVAEMGGIEPHPEPPPPRQL